VSPPLPLPLSKTNENVIYCKFHLPSVSAYFWGVKAKNNLQNAIFVFETLKFDALSTVLKSP
jgi:hypothetical protein